ncbi:hypothetical protein AOLI_G00027810 [Acnodon oligacanthus]
MFMQAVKLDYTRILLILTGHRRTAYVRVGALSKAWVTGGNLQLPKQNRPNILIPTSCVLTFWNTFNHHHRNQLSFHHHLSIYQTFTRTCFSEDQLKTQRTLCQGVGTSTYRRTSRDSLLHQHGAQELSPTGSSSSSSPPHGPVENHRSSSSAPIWAAGGSTPDLRGQGGSAWLFVSHLYSDKLRPLRHDWVLAQAGSPGWSQ